MRRNFHVLVAILLLLGCSSKPKFAANDCVIPPDASGQDKILKIVSVTPSEYRVTGYSLSSGKVVPAPGEQVKSRGELENGYSLIDCPKDASH